MITSLQGTLVSATPLGAVIEVGGIGYDVHIPVTTAERLPRPGETVKLHTIAIYREDSQTLYGFASVEERDFFRLLVGTVSGVGPRIAVTIMSRLSLPVLRRAILDGDVGLLAKCHGIGRKTAERLVVELKDKLAPGGAISSGASVELGGASAAVSPEEDSPDRRMRDAVLALTALGFKVPDAEKAVRKIAASLGNDASVEDLVKRALAS